MDEKLPSDPGFSGKISKTVKNMGLSLIKKMELLGKSIDSVETLGQGLHSFNTPEYIKKDVINAMKHNLTDKYSVNYGLPELRKAIAEKLNKENKINADFNEVVATTGAIQATMNALFTLINPGEEVLLSTPGYSTHIRQVKLANGLPVYFPLIEEEEWKPDIDELRKKINEKTKAIILNTPNNPTGAVFNEKTQREIAGIALENDLIVITDETYEYFVYDNEKRFSLGSIEEMKNNTVSVFSLSKSYAMTGWRVGYMHAPEEIINQVIKVQDCLTICASLPSQYAAISALKHGREKVDEMSSVYRGRRDYVMKRLDSIDWLSYAKPKGTYYILPKILDENADSFEFAKKLQREAKVTSIPGSTFGPTAEGHLRFSYGNKENLPEIFDRIENWKP